MSNSPIRLKYTSGLIPTRPHFRANNIAKSARHTHLRGRIRARENAPVRASARRTHDVRANRPGRFRPSLLRLPTIRLRAPTTNHVRAPTIRLRAPTTHLVFAATTTPDVAQMFAATALSPGEHRGHVLLTLSYCRDRYLQFSRYTFDTAATQQPQPDRPVNRRLYSVHPAPPEAPATLAASSDRDLRAHAMPRTPLPNRVATTYCASCPPPGSCVRPAP